MVGGNSRRRTFYLVGLVVAMCLIIITIQDRRRHQRNLPFINQVASHVANPVLPNNAPREQVEPVEIKASSLKETQSDSANVNLEGGIVNEPTSLALRQTSSMKVATSHSKSNDVFVKTPGSSKLAEFQRVDLKSLSANQLEEMYFSIAEQQHIQCPSSRRIGDVLDGGWDVCFSDPYNISKSQPCVAFSFGINNIWGYDDLLADSYKCKVYMFDPSMSSIADHQRKNTSWFYRTGLSSNNNVTSNGWKMRTLCRLFKELDFDGKFIDILKVDIEYWEWDSFEQAIRDGCLRQVKQLLFESHTGEMLRQKSDYARFIRVWLGLVDLGFRSWKWHKNPQSVFYTSDNGVNRACCYEHYMINTSLL